MKQHGELTVYIRYIQLFVKPQEFFGYNSTDLISGFLIPAGLIVLVYIWLGYSMNVGHDPILAMLIYYPVFCLGGGVLLRKLKSGKSTIEKSEIVSNSNPLLLTIQLSIAATIVLWSSLLLFRPGWIDPEIVSGGLEACKMHREEYWRTGWVVAIVNPIFEELLWRWGLVSFLESRFSRTVTIHISALLFAGYHPIVVAQFFPLPWLILVFVIVHMGGIALAHLFLRTRNIIYPIVFHMVVNINLMLVGYIFAPLID